MSSCVVEFHNELSTLQECSADKNIQTMTGCFPAPAELNFVEKILKKFVRITATLLEQLPEHGRPTVNVVLYEGTVGEKLILADFALLIGMGN